MPSPLWPARIWGEPPSAQLTTHPPVMPLNGPERLWWPGRARQEPESAWGWWSQGHRWSDGGPVWHAVYGGCDTCHLLLHWPPICSEHEPLVPHKRKRKIQKSLRNKSKHQNNKCLSWVTAVRVLSLAGSHSPPHLPRMPSSTVLVSGPALRAAQVLIWSYSCLSLPPVSTAIRTSAFSPVGALSGLVSLP